MNPCPKVEYCPKHPECTLDMRDEWRRCYICHSQDAFKHGAYEFTAEVLKEVYNDVHQARER
jgi:hypothetical protein